MTASLTVPALTDDTTGMKIAHIPHTATAQSGPTDSQHLLWSHPSFFFFFFKSASLHFINTCTQLFFFNPLTFTQKLTPFHISPGEDSIHISVLIIKKSKYQKAHLHFMEPSRCFLG